MLMDGGMFFFHFMVRVVAPNCVEGGGRSEQVTGTATRLKKTPR